jgi:hypothetical protein
MGRVRGGSTKRKGLGGWVGESGGEGMGAVSYTHLTLPTTIGV